MAGCEEYRMNGFDDEYSRVNGVQKESDKYEPADRDAKICRVQAACTNQDYDINGIQIRQRNAV